MNLKRTYNKPTIKKINKTRKHQVKKHHNEIQTPNIDSKEKSSNKLKKNESSANKRIGVGDNLNLQKTNQKERKSVEYECNKNSPEEVKNDKTLAMTLSVITYESLFKISCSNSFRFRRVSINFRVRCCLKKYRNDLNRGSGISLDF